MHISVLPIVNISWESIMRQMNLFWKLWSITQSKNFHISDWGRATRCLEIFSRLLSACKRPFKKIQKMLKYLWIWLRPTKPNKRIYGAGNGFKNALISTKIMKMQILCSAIWRFKRRSFKRHCHITIRSSRLTPKILKLSCILGRSTKKRNRLGSLRNGSEKLLM